MVGRVKQKERTRRAIAEAARALVEAGGEVTMPAVASRAGVSEATAYRYFPDLVTLLRDAVQDTWPTPDDLLGAELAGVDDVGERVARAARVFCGRTLRHERAVRAIVAASLTGASEKRPAHRFEVIDYALGPVPDGTAKEATVRALAVVISAEALFTLLDLCGLAPEEATESLVETAQRCATRL
ncbi:TetR/AcrR family transcriptional regulator [Actinomycetospora endophytica]|uniref:TetR/AcrR family transcriptional regulator n=1 Tax=Actinomycetospora endophytica TaxID=2291215 RepID=A0ABS8PH49_9PSEU|nr:TetR/AcrR family transcriptional regulator [Actinomycetospora endophytica]MCD2196314.1 TetR/AcrR family transcriptional regulator [Actinomycetospora endophytica]